MELGTRREFGYLGLLEDLVARGYRFVICVRMGSRDDPHFVDAEGQKIEPFVARGQQTTYFNVFYRGKVEVNLVGVWLPQMRRPLWLVTNLPAEQAWALYRHRMKIEESFRELQTYLGLNYTMNKTRFRFERVLGWLLIAYIIGVMNGE